MLFNCYIVPYCIIYGITFCVFCTLMNDSKLQRQRFEFKYRITEQKALAMRFFLCSLIWTWTFTGLCNRISAIRFTAFTLTVRH